MKNMALRWLIFTEGVVKEQGISKRVCSCSWLEWSEPQYELCGVAQGLCAFTVHSHFHLLTLMLVPEQERTNIR